jgi:hypothetical protein
MEAIMKVKFERPVEFSTLTRAFVGEGIPPIPADARRVKVSERVTGYVARSCEVWEFFNGKGASVPSETFYWPSRDLCPRDWVKEL